MINSPSINGLDIYQAKNKIIENENNKIGRRKSKFQIKGLGISRQRFWGCPILLFMRGRRNISSKDAELPVAAEIKNFTESSSAE